MPFVLQHLLFTVAETCQYARAWLIHEARFVLQDLRPSKNIVAGGGSYDDLPSATSDLGPRIISCFESPPTA